MEPVAERRKQARVYTPLIIGAAIGLVPSLVVTFTQASFQRHEALFEQRLVVLRELSNTAHGEGTRLLSQNNALQAEIRNADVARMSASGLQTINEHLAQCISEFYDWTAKLNTQMNLIKGLWNVDVSVIDIVDRMNANSHLDILALPGQSAVGRVPFSEPERQKLLTDLEVIHQSIVSIVKDMQRALDSVSRRLDE